MSFDPNGGPMAPRADDKKELPDLIEPHKDKKVLKTFLTVVVILLLVGGLLYGVYTLFIKKDPVTQPTQTTPTTTEQTPITKADVPESTTTKPYENGPMGLKLTYPDTWKVTETADRGVRVESPTFTYATLDKGDVSGNFRIYIRKGARAADGAVIGRGVAIQPSEKLVYTQPAPDQRKDTLLTLFGLDTKDNFGFFLIAGNFQLNVGDTLGPDYGKEPDAFIVGGGYSSPDLSDDMATHTVAISTIPTSKAYAQAVEIIKSLQLH